MIQILYRDSLNTVKKQITPHIETSWKCVEVELGKICMTSSLVAQKKWIKVLLSKVYTGFHGNFYYHQPLGTEMAIKNMSSEFCGWVGQRAELIVDFRESYSENSINDHYV